MPLLYRADTNEPVGEINEQMLAQLKAALEEEGPDDQDYFIDERTLAYLEERGVHPELLDMLRGSIGATGAEFRWNDE